MCKIVEFKKPCTEEENRLEFLLKLIKTDINKLNNILKSEKLDAEELCIVVEELCRYERTHTLSAILDKHSEVLYYHHCDILDIAVGTCNLELIKMVLSKYETDYSPSIKYEGSCHRAIENKRKDILEVLKEHKVNII